MINLLWPKIKSGKIFDLAELSQIIILTNVAYVPNNKSICMTVCSLTNKIFIKAMIDVFVGTLSCNPTDVAVARKQMSSGMNQIYSLCLNYKIELLHDNFSKQMSQWSTLWHCLALSNKFISEEMVKNIIDNLMDTNLTLHAVYKLLSSLNEAG